MEDLAFDKMMCERNLADHKLGVFMLGVEKNILNTSSSCGFNGFELPQCTRADDDIIR